MSRLRHTDILLELIELAQELINEVRQQLVYYRASVYKDETAKAINQQIDQLRLVTSLVGDEMLQEPLRDYDAMAGRTIVDPGECSYAKRVTCLLAGLEDQMARLARKFQLAASDEKAVELTKQVQKHRRQLLAVCRHGSRQWAFFHSL